MKKYFILFLILITSFIGSSNVNAYTVGSINFGRVNKVYHEVGGTSEYSIYQYRFQLGFEWFDNLRFLALSHTGIGPDVDTVYPIGAVDYQLNIWYGSTSQTLGYVDMMIYKTNVTPGLEEIQFWYNGSNIFSVNIDDMASLNWYLRTTDILTFNFDMYQRGFNDAQVNNQIQIQEAVNQTFEQTRTTYGIEISGIWYDADTFGYQEYLRGFTEGQETSYSINVLDTITQAAAFTDYILSADLGGGFNLYQLFLIPITFGLIFILIKFAKGG
jgi:hypothetical protein